MGDLNAYFKSWEDKMETLKQWSWKVWGAKILRSGAHVIASLIASVLVSGKAMAIVDYLNVNFGTNILLDKSQIIIGLTPLIVVALRSLTDFLGLHLDVKAGDVAKVVVALFLIMGPKPAYALDIVDQVFTQTKVTIHKSGAAGVFYDASVGRSDAVKAGLVSHVLTNRFVTLDAGLYAGTDDVFVFGPGLKTFPMLAHYFPKTAGVVRFILPEQMTHFDIGLNGGWRVQDTSVKEFHYGAHLVYGF